MVLRVNLPQIPYKADTAVPDYVAALTQGFTQGLKPRSDSEALLSAVLGNKIKATQEKYAEPMNQMKMKLLQAQTQRALRPAQPALNNLEKAMAGYERVKQAYGANSPEAEMAKSYVNRIAQGSNGINIMTDPETGQQMISIGGSARGGRGGGLFQTESGEILSKPSNTTQSNLEQRIVGTETVAPYLQEVMEKLPQFQSLTSKAKNIAEGASNLVFGTNYKGPSEFAAGRAAIKKASEGMLKQFGLNSTGANRQAMEDILTPALGESDKGYKERVRNELKDFVETKKYSSRALTRGLSLGKPEENVPKAKENKDTIRIVNTKMLDGKKYYQDKDGNWYDSDPNE